MKIKFIDKIEEADEIQDGNGDTNASQEIKTDIQNKEDGDQSGSYSSDVTDLQQDASDIMTKKTQLKTQYQTNLKYVNDQTSAIIKQRNDLEDIAPENDEQADITKNKIIQSNVLINTLLNKKLMLKNTYQMNIKNLDQKLMGINQKIAANGGNISPNCIDEQVKINARFSKKLFESVLNKTDEMFAEICLAFEQIDDLSYTPDNTRCRTFARNIVAYLNKIGWDSGNKENEFKTFVYNLLTASHLSLSLKEKDMFIDNLVGLMKSNALFKWVFA